MDIAVLVVNSIASLTAIIGLIITGFQFSKTMKAQNRSINVSLFDLRMEIFTRVESDELTFNRTKAKLLFNSDIAGKIEKYDSAVEEYKRYRGLKREFLELVQQDRADDTYEEATDLLKVIDRFETIEQNDSTGAYSQEYQQLKEFIRHKSYIRKRHNSENPFEMETVNYIDAQEQESLFYSKAESIRKEIIAEMKQFIERSIQ